MTDPAIQTTQSLFELASKSDVGQVRSANEDSCDTALRPDGAWLLVVADGMGGHRGGATASRTAVDTIRERFLAESSTDPQTLLREAIEAANALIFEMAQSDPDLEGMGTTVVAFVVDAEGQATVAHVGDSRAYRYRRSLLEPLTGDHSVVAEMQRRGLLSAEEAAAHPRRNEILRSVGVLDHVDVEVAAVEIQGGDRFLLCSDGLSGVLSDDEIAAVLQSQPPRAAVESLVEMANARGGPDNITVQILAKTSQADEGDPEATAPVELSDFGIELIESNRRKRILTRRLGIFALALAAVIVGYLGWKSFATSEATSEARSEATSSSPRPSTPASARPADTRPAHDAEAPRRGIPR